MKGEKPHTSKIKHRVNTKQQWVAVVLAGDAVGRISWAPLGKSRFLAKAAKGAKEGKETSESASL